MWVLGGLLLWAIIAVTPVVAQEGEDGEGQQAATWGWRITPRLSVGTTYSDNIRQAPDDEAESDLVLRVEPGVSMSKKGGRLELQLNYTAQGLLYANNSSDSTVNHYLRAFSAAELYQDHLFLDAYGSISQVLLTSGGRLDPGDPVTGEGNPAFGNVALADDLTTAGSFGISPYWRQNFGGWAEALLRYRYTNTVFGESSFDSAVNAINFNLASSRRFSALKWNLDYRYQQQDFQETQEDNTDTSRVREDVAGRMDYRLSSQWTLVANGGYVNNENTTLTDNVNGAYWGLGAIWTPSRFFSIGASGGLNFYEGGVRWSPSQRTSLEITRTYRGVGASPGTYWDGALTHRTRYMTWSASYNQEVTNTQLLLGDSLIGVGPDGRPIALDEEGQAALIDGSFGLSNQDFLRKRFAAGVTYQRGRTGLGFNLFNEAREYQDAASDESAYGADAFWRWRFATRTASLLRIRWQQEDLSDDQRNKFWLSEIGLTRDFNPDMDGRISYRYYQNDADPADEGFRENRLDARLNMRF